MEKGKEYKDCKEQAAKDYKKSLFQAQLSQSYTINITGAKVWFCIFNLILFKTKVSVKFTRRVRVHMP